jgi:translation initiation factor 1
VRIERGGRKGKTVTVCGPFFLARDEAARLLAGLKRGCGSGGTLKRGTTASGAPCEAIEIQGDHVGRLIERLSAIGYPVRRG